jgi:hypothetical protein
MIAMARRAFVANPMEQIKNWTIVESVEIRWIQSASAMATVSDEF